MAGKNNISADTVTKLAPWVFGGVALMWMNNILNKKPDDPNKPTNNPEAKYDGTLYQQWATRIFGALNFIPALSNEKEIFKVAKAMSAGDAQKNFTETSAAWNTAFKTGAWAELVSDFRGLSLANALQKGLTTEELAEFYRILYATTATTPATSSRYVAGQQIVLTENESLYKKVGEKMFALDGKRYLSKGAKVTVKAVIKDGATYWIMLNVNNESRWIKVA